MNSIRYLDYEINALNSQRVNLAERRQSILDRAHPTAALSGVCVQTMPGSKTESLGIELASLPDPVELVKKLNGLQERVNRKLDTLIDKRQIAMELIDCVEDGAYRVLLLNRYVNTYPWIKVAAEMDYTDSYCRDDLKDNALKAFEVVWENSRQKPTDNF